MDSIFKGKRPYLGQPFMKAGSRYIVASIALNVIVGRRCNTETAQHHTDITTVKEKFS